MNKKAENFLESRKHGENLFELNNCWLQANMRDLSSTMVMTEETHKRVDLASHVRAADFRVPHSLGNDPEIHLFRARHLITVPGYSHLRSLESSYSQIAPHDADLINQINK